MFAHILHSIFNKVPIYLYFISLQTAFNGWTDENSEGSWTAVGNKNLSMEAFQPWSRSEPNGKERENCGVINSNINEWEDWQCSSHTCIICDSPSHITYVLRGLCKSTLLDTYFAWSAKDNDNLIRGYTKSVMVWTKEGWRINVYNNLYTYALYNESRFTPIYGAKYWSVFNDTCKYDESSIVIHDEHSLRILLSLNTCGPNEFNCDDGTW